MRNFIDEFYELVHKNSLKRRRMVSLLLVLSMFVSTGVLWELRDTGITMVNDVEEYDVSDHIHTMECYGGNHTEECYSDVLICEDESEEHTHTDECYERKLVCEDENHLYLLCEETEDDAEKSEDDLEEVVIYCPSSDEESENEEDDEENPEDDEDLVEVDAEFPELTLEDEPMALFENIDHDFRNKESENPGTVSTIDNIANGIKFTLFDYGDNSLERNNNYDITAWDSDTSTATRGNIKYNGINTDKSVDTDILFFEYGTPNFIGATNNKKEVATYQRIPANKNSYSGDYFSSETLHLEEVSGNRAVQNIVNNTLTNGFPTIRNDDGSTGNSLDYLFSKNPGTYKTVYTDVNHFLQEDSAGHLFYDSNDNYAYFNQDSKEFTIYDTTYHIINNDHHYANETNELTEEKYKLGKGYEMQIGFFPFDEYDWTRRDPNFNGNGFNHHFGMTMEANFKMTNDGYITNKENQSEPIVFSYSGDDDMWVFIDGVLVLDVGGIHEPAAGMIDFTNGLVWVQDDAEGESEESLSQYKNYPHPKGYGETMANGQKHKWLVTTLASKFDGITINNKEVKWDSDPNVVHSINMFYLERGGCYSNLAMDINIPILKPLTVMKNVDYGTHSEHGYDDEMYRFEILEYDTNSNTFVPANLGEDSNKQQISNVFTLKAGEKKTFYNLDQNKVFKVVEKGVKGSIFSQVDVSDSSGTHTVYDGTIVDIESTSNRLEDFGIYNFTNKVKEEKSPIDISKKWDGNTLENYVVKFKIFRHDLTDKNDVPRAVSVVTNGVKKKTFTLSNATEWKYSFEALQTRYGEHIYTYSVEEINVPDQYKASYSIDENGNITITNTDISKTEINVKKKWENISDINNLSVDVKLTREKVGYQPSAKTSLEVEMQDEKGNFIRTFSTDNVYIGGDVEFALNAPPKGVEMISAKNAGSSGMGVSLDDGVVDVTNLQSGSNKVIIKVTTDEYEDSLMLLHHSFEDNDDSNSGSLCGWTKQGDNVNIEVKNSYNYAKGKHLMVSKRTNFWNGIKLQLDPLMFKVNKTYSFSVYVKSPVSTKFKMTFNDGLQKGYQGQDSYHEVNTFMYDTPNEWKKLSGTVTIPYEQNPYAMFLLIETDEEYENDIFNSSDGPNDTYFFIDEFVAVEGNQIIDVEKDTGIVTIGNGKYNVGEDSVVDIKYIYNAPTMKDFEYTGWEKDGNDITSITGNSNSYGYKIEVRNRIGKDDTVKRVFSNLVANQLYHFKGQVSGIYGIDYSQDVEVLLKYNNAKGETVCVQASPSGATKINGSSWKNIDFLYRIPKDVVGDVTLSLEVKASDGQEEKYYNPDSKTNPNTSGFDLWNFTVTEASDTLGNISGYEIKNDKYVLNYSNISVEFDEDSISVPLQLQGDYAVDVGWFKEITLNSANGWEKQWRKSDLNEAEHTLYKYHIEEVWVDDEGNTIETDANGNLITKDGNYLVTYTNNDVATNDNKNPILVTNKYIWYKLPATGGIGTKPIYLLGTVLTMAGILSGCNIYRRKRRQDEMAS